MRDWIESWLDARRRRAERDAFARGYEWAKAALDHGSCTPEALYAYANGTFNADPNERAFDRGVNTAATEARHA